MYDLHVHTTASDGTATPPEVLEKAVQIGLLGLSITDHDTIAGLPIAQKYLDQNNLPIEFIPGIEMSTEAFKEDIHILGYFIDYANCDLLQKLKQIREARAERAVKMIDKLTSMGIDIDINDVKKYAKTDFIGRPHIAMALISKGYITSIREGFVNYIGRGKPAYEPRYKFTPAEAIDLIRKSGGVCVLAHPGLIGNETVIQEVIDMGVEGLEVYYPEHTPYQIKNYLKLCNENNLLVTGGSDYHGHGSTGSRNNLGCSGISAKLFKKLYDAIGRPL